MDELSPRRVGYRRVKGDSWGVPARQPSSPSGSDAWDASYSSSTSYNYLLAAAVLIPVYTAAAFDSPVSPGLFPTSKLYTLTTPDSHTRNGNIFKVGVVGVGGVSTVGVLGTQQPL